MKKVLFMMTVLVLVGCKKENVDGPHSLKSTNKKGKVTVLSDYKNKNDCNREMKDLQASGYPENVECVSK